MRANLLFRSLVAVSLGALLLPSAPAQFAGSQAPPTDLARGFGDVSQQQLRQWLQYLTVDCQGRGHLQPGYLKAADYLAAHFKKLGLKPAGDNGTYFQQVPFFSATLKPEASYIQVGADKIPVGPDFGFQTVGENLDFSAGVVFINFGTGNKPLPPETNLKDKVVITVGTVSRDVRRQLQEARLVLTVSPSMPTPRPASGSGRPPAASARITPAGAARVAKAMQVDESIVDVEKALPDRARLLLGDKLKVVAKVDGKTEYQPNVVAILEGSDPVLKHEYVGLGAHLDHLGVRGNEIYYGADDDGSGTVALMAIAKMMKTNPVKPKRSILFMAFCAEEVGLVGSRYLADNPVIPLDKMICELQMDMVGRDSYGPQNGDRNRIDVEAENRDTMRLVGSKRISMELHNLILDANAHVNFKFKYDSEDVYTRSDHYAFAAKGIPVAFMFCGFTPDYHRPTDTIEKINFEKIANTAKLYYLVSMKAAAKPERFKNDVPLSGGDGS